MAISGGLYLCLEQPRGVLSTNFCVHPFIDIPCHIPKWSLKPGGLLTISSVKDSKFWSKTILKENNLNIFWKIDFFNFSNEIQCDIGFVANITIGLFAYNYYSWPSLYAFSFGHYPRQKKYISFWAKNLLEGIFATTTKFQSFSILIISHFGHFLFYDFSSSSFSLCLWHLLLAHVYFAFLFLFFKAFLNGQQSNYWTHLREILAFFNSAVSGYFPRQKWNFEGPFFLLQNPPKNVFFNT